ncbi:uncharacterized protein [Dendropsophus ebraccatus]|uniref:uncharacterized protein n=1 Tax=Dendropsophus ebraccatus TaxID=150705 RepID=UPI0038310669
MSTDLSKACQANGTSQGPGLHRPVKIEVHLLHPPPLPHIHHRLPVAEAAPAVKIPRNKNRKRRPRKNTTKRIFYSNLRVRTLVVGFLLKRTKKDSYRLPKTIFVIVSLYKNFPYSSVPFFSSAMPSCLIKGCFNTWKQKDSKVILHVFPRDKDGIRLWLSQSPENFPNVEELVERIYSQNAYGTVRLCSKHFNDDQYFHEGTKRRLRPNAIPTIFTTESPPSQTPGTKKGTKRQRKAANSDSLMDGENNEGASSSVLFIAQTPDGGNTLVQQVLPSHLQIVLPRTSLLAMGKARMADKAVNTDAFFSKKCQAVGTDPMLGKRNATMQTKPWKGKSQGVLCTILNGDMTNSDQHKSWQSEKIWANSIRFPSTSKPIMGQVAGNVLSKQQFVSHATVTPQAMFPKKEHEPIPISKNIKVERMSPHSHSGQSSNSNQDGSSESIVDPSQTRIVRIKDEDFESGSSTDDDSEKEDLATKNVPDNVEGRVGDSSDQAKFTVLQSCLYDLIKLVRCQYRHTCHAPLTNVQIKTLGSVIAIDVLCSKGHNSTLWHSQSVKRKLPAGNLLPISGGPAQTFEGLHVETYFHNLDYEDELPH